MSKIPRKIVQAVLRSGGKALTRLANSRIGEKLDTASTRKIRRAIIDQNLSTANKNRIPEKIILRVTKELLDRKLITPRQAGDVDLSMSRGFSYNQNPPTSQHVRSPRRLEQAKNVSQLRNLNETANWNKPHQFLRGKLAENELQRLHNLSQKASQHKKFNYIKAMKEVYDVIEEQSAKRTKQYNEMQNRAKKLWNIQSQQEKNYRVGRELLSVLGKAGLTGLAGAQLASSIASGKDVKKMANRRNKYFS